MIKAQDGRLLSALKDLKKTCVFRPTNRRPLLQLPIPFSQNITRYCSSYIAMQPLKKGVSYSHRSFGQTNRNFLSMMFCSQKRTAPGRENAHLISYKQHKRFLSSKSIKVKKFYAIGPMKWLDLKAKMFLMRGFFDREFDEEDFLQGARQAICLVSSYISKQKFEKLSGILSEKAKDDSQEIYNNTTDKKKIEIREDDIEMLRVNNMDFIYDGTGKKWADILVTCFCISEESVSKRIGDMDFVGLPSQRVYHFAFVREFTPGATSDWVVDRIEMFKSI